MKTSLVAEHLENLVKADLPAFLWGPPGIGKSDITKQLAEKLKADLIDIRASLLDPVDLRGIPYRDENGRTRWAPPVFLPAEPETKKSKRTTILFLDELNVAPLLVQGSLYQLLLNRQLGEYTLPSNVRLLAAGNRATDRAVVNRMSSALTSRLVHLTVEVDLNDWVAWAIDHDIKLEIIAFLRFKPDLLHDFKPDKDLNTYSCPRTWEFLSKYMTVCPDVNLEVVKGIVGAGAATEFVSFLRVYRNLPDIDALLMNPSKFKVPTDPSVRYAICTALAARATEQNFSRIVNLANMLPDEFSVLLIRDATSRNEDLLSSAAYVKWGSKHADVLF